VRLRFKEGDLVKVAKFLNKNFPCLLFGGQGQRFFNFENIANAFSIDIERIKGYSNSEESRGDNAGDADYIDLGYGFYDEIH